jgi:glycosyltransferase involved in cell wall biosynthesis
LAGGALERVSVILPVYNAEQYLPAALASIMLQDHDNLEIICVNDGSSDRSAEILQQAAAQEPRIILIDRGNRGLIATLNEGIALASGDLIARMDADDIAYPNRISAQVQAFRENRKLALSGCFFDTIYSPRRMLAAAAPDATQSIDLRVMSRFFTILRHPTVMFRRSSIPEGMLHYDEAYPCAEDFDLFRRIAEVCDVAQTTEPLLAYRLHENSVSATRISTMVQSHVAIVEESLKRHYPEAAGTGFTDVAHDVNAATVASSADLIRRLDRIEASQPENERRAFHIGTTTTFYFLFSLIREFGSYGMACDFIEQANHWGMIRRRERPVLRMARHVPLVGGLGHALLDANLKAQRWINSRDLRRIIPAHDAISAVADRLVCSSPAKGPAHA